MSAFANNPWVKKDKARADGADDEPQIKKPERKPRKITNKNPFGSTEDKKEPLKPKKPKPAPRKRKESSSSSSSDSSEDEHKGLTLE
jgi:hypothetical protein